MEGSVDIPKTDADRTEEAVRDFLDHLHDDLPYGPMDPIDEMRGLYRRTESEFRRLAELGKRMIDNYETTTKSEPIKPS